MRRLNYNVSNKRLLGLILVSSMSLTLQGCGDKTLIRLSSDLAVAGKDCPQKVSDFYAHLNKEHHKMDTDELNLKGVPELQGVNIPEPGSFTARFDQDDVIKPRVKMAELLSAYCSQIYSASNAKDIAQADQVVSGLNSTVTSIGKDLLSIQSIASKIPLGAISALAQPAKTLGALGIKGVFSIVRENWAKDLISGIDKSFEEVCLNMQRDLNNSANDAKRRAANIVHLNKVALNRKIDKGISTDERAKLSAELDSLGKYADTVAAGNPADNFEVMKDKMHQLATWAATKTAQYKKYQFWKK